MKEKEKPKAEETNENSNIPFSKRMKLFISKNKLRIIFIGSFILMAIILAILIPIFLKKYENDVDNDNILSSAFKINTKENTLTQFSFKSSQNYESITKGEKSPYIIFSKAKYEIYTLNSSKPSKKEQKYYKKKYTTSIAINSYCKKLSLNSDENECELESIFDLNKREQHNLRRNEENEELLSKAILPICIVEHTDTNLIISLTCPETFSPSFKNDLIQAFQNIKPNSTKAITSFNNYIDIIDSKDSNEIHINISNKECHQDDISNSKSTKCNSLKEIITDKDGNLLSINKIINKDIYYNEEDKSIQNSSFEFQLISEKNSSNYNPRIYRTNLDLFLSKTSSLMKKEILINNFTSYFLNLTQKKELNKNKLRNLDKEQISKNKGIFERNIFNKNVFDIPIEYNIKNDIGLGESESAKTYSLYKINNQQNTQLSVKQYQSDLNNILEEFISLVKSRNKLAYLLNKEINEPLLNLKNIIIENIEKINLFLPNKDLSEIFDSTFALNEIKTLPYEFISIIGNLSESLDDLGNNIHEIINNTMIKLNNDIYTYLSDLHYLISQLFNNLTEITEFLYSNKSKIAEVSSHYLNKKDTNYSEFIPIFKELLINYYKKEAEKILPLVNSIYNKFYDKTNEFIQKSNYKLNNISERITKDNLVIISSTSEEKNLVLNYIKNIKDKIDEILVIIENKFKESINIKENGYLETQEVINEKIQSYDKVISKAFNITKTLDNNELIDINYDKIMTDFKDNLLSILNYMENNLKEKFPIEENVLSISFFDNIYIKNIDESFKSEKVNIITFLKNENNEYLNSMENIFNSFMTNNATHFNQINSKILNDFNEIIIEKLITSFNDAISFIFNSLNGIIEYNKNLGNEYLNNVKKANSYHMTQGFIDKYNIYINNIQRINDFINNDLKINLENKYNNIINQLNEIFKSIQSTNDNIFKKYKKQLITFEESYLKLFQTLFDRLNKHLTKDIFNEKFLPLINNYIKTSNNSLQNIKTDFEDIYNNIAKKSKSTSSKDYDVEHVSGGDRYCCHRFLGACVDHCRTPVVHSYEGKNVEGTNNHLNLSEIQFSEYVKNFDTKYNELYTILFKDISSYNSFLPFLVSNIKQKTDKIVKDDGSNYMNNIIQNVNNIIEEKLGNNLLNTSFNYYEKEITNILPKVLDNILEKWKTIYDDIYKNITNNKMYFKSLVNEFYIIASNYIENYKNYKFYNYINSIISKIKNELNYTNKYYYDLINSKVNEFCSYIINNSPINEAPLDEVINLRLNEINKSCNKMLNQIQNNRTFFLNKNNQETVLNIKQNNYFFNIDNIIKEYLESFNHQLNEKRGKIKLIVDESQSVNNNPEELIISKFYIENNINKNHLNNIYKKINEANFIDMRNDVYHNMINSIWKNDKDDLAKRIRNFINELDKNETSDFNNELEKYINLIKDKIYNEFYTKENLEAKINTMFSQGLNNMNTETKQKILDIIDSILNKVKYHIMNESNRLKNELTSYSNNFEYIQKRISNYKNIIYEQFYSIITSKIKIFQETIMEKLYKNHLEKGIDEFLSYFNNEDLGSVSFLNMNINLDEILRKEINTFMKEYKDIALGRIELLTKKAMNNFEELLPFSNIKAKINNEIDSYYNTLLLPILKKEAIYIYNNDYISYYDLSSSIVEDIDNFISEGIIKSNEIVKIMEGKHYEINEVFKYNMSNVKKDIVLNIKTQFAKFSSYQISKENQEFNKNMDEIIINNFDSILVNFIPLFSVDFFDRILKYNEIQKINVLNDDLNYTLYHTMIYYLNLSSTYGNQKLPLDLKNGILTLNDIESTINSKGTEILSTLNSKFSTYFEEEKNYFSQRYITDINNDPIFETQFDKNLMEKIKQKLNENSNKIEEKFIEEINKNVKTSFINEYKNILNKSNEALIKSIKEYKNQLSQKLKNNFVFDSDIILQNIKNKFKDINSLNEKYNAYLGEFQISDEIKNFIENKLSNEIIISKYNDFNDLLNIKSAESVKNKIDFYSNEFKSKYSFEKFEELINRTNSNLTSYLNKYIQILNNFGSNKDVYASNLQKELIKYDYNIKTNEKEFYTISEDISFNNLKNISINTMKFIINLDLFNKFSEIINDNINKKNNQYEYSKYILNLNKNNSNNDYMFQRLNELNDISLKYYWQANNIFISMKNKLINSIIEINELINHNENIANEVLNNNYHDIIRKYKSIRYNDTKTEESISIPEYIYYDFDSDNIFGIETSINNYKTNNEFSFDTIYDEKNATTKVIANLINNIKPKSFIIDAYSSNGPTGKIGRKINVIFNNIHSKSNIIFDGKLINATVTHNFNFEEYYVKTQYYEERITSFNIVILGITFTIPETRTIQNIETPYNEKYYEIASKNETIIENYQY